jgi:hypothetical protein
MPTRRFDNTRFCPAGSKTDGGVSMRSLIACLIGSIILLLFLPGEERESLVPQSSPGVAPGQPAPRLSDGRSPVSGTYVAQPAATAHDADRRQPSVPDSVERIRFESPLNFVTGRDLIAILVRQQERLRAAAAGGGEQHLAAILRVTPIVY